MAKPKKGSAIEKFSLYRQGIEVTVEPCEDVPPPINEPAQSTKKKLDTWSKCEECGQDLWTDYRGTYYHRLACSKSNGIGYGKEMSKEPLVKHHIACECLCCSKDIGRRESIMAGGG